MVGEFQLSRSLGHLWVGEVEGKLGGAFEDFFVEENRAFSGELILIVEFDLGFVFKDFESIFSGSVQ